MNFKFVLSTVDKDGALRDENLVRYEIGKVTKGKTLDICNVENLIRELAIKPTYKIYIAEPGKITKDETGQLQTTDEIKLIREATNVDIATECKKDSAIIYPVDPLTRSRKSKQIEDCLKVVVDSLPEDLSTMEDMIINSQDDIEKILFFHYYGVYIKGLKTKKTKIDTDNKYEKFTLSAYIMKHLGSNSKDIFYLDKLIKLGCVLSHDGKKWIALGKGRNAICSYNIVVNDSNSDTATSTVTNTRKANKKKKKSKTKGKK